MFDDKNLAVNDRLEIIDKLDPKSAKTWQVIGIATVTEVVEKRLEDIAEREITGQEQFATKKQMIKQYRLYYGDSVDGSSVVKIIYFDFEPITRTAITETLKLAEAKLYTDGGSRNNPGPSACAYVICNLDDSVVEKSGFYMGISTNNKAEYQGLRLGLERCAELGVRKLDVFMDSQLVVNQAKGLYKVKNADLAAVHQEVMTLAKLFDEIRFTYVPREINKRADKEVNRILDEQVKN